MFNNFAIYHHGHVARDEDMLDFHLLMQLLHQVDNVPAGKHTALKRFHQLHRTILVI